MEVAFDPMRHDLTVVWNGRMSMEASHAIHETGWSPLACTDSAQIWARDRAFATSRNLSRAAVSAAGLGVGL